MSTHHPAHQRIAARYGFAESEILIGLLTTMMTPTEAEWLVELPATAGELAARLGQEPDAVAAGLADLFDRGLALIRELTPAGPLYFCDDNPGRLMDLVLFDRRYVAQYGVEFLDRWRVFYNRELVHNYEWPDPTARPFRVVPVAEHVRDPRAAMPYERVADLVRGARRISVQRCPCRLRERACDNPLETCLAFDRAADYHLQRKIGREIDEGEALAILARVEELGLVHLTENGDRPDLICNCCPCCCVFLRAMTVHGKQDVIHTSRFVAQIDPEACQACGACVQRCHFAAIAQESGPAQVDAARCFGCGLCTSTCPAGAITLAERAVRPFILTQEAHFLGDAREIQA